MKCKQIVFTEKDKAELLETDVKELKENEVMVETMVSTISCGTERANITGNPNVDGGHSYGVSFPRYLGYNSAGVVVKKGSAVKSVDVGDRVVVIWAFHKKYNVVSEENVIKIEDNAINLETGAMCLIASFPMAAIRKTRLEIGESALVMGLGILGMIAVKLLNAAGAVPIIAADPNPVRREIALQNGADYAFDPFEEDFAQKVKKVTKGGANVAIEVTGVGDGFNEALDCMARFGRVALLGCTRSSDFTVDYYGKIHAPGITVIGAHTAARPNVESHPGWFTHRDDIKAIMKLCSAERLCLENLIEETHLPEECPEVYNRLINDKNFPVAVQFDWRNLK